MNAIQITGRLTRNADVRYGDGYVIANYTVAVNRGKDKPADFFDCKAFGKAAETAGKYFTKGMPVAVSGSIHFDEYTKKDGTKAKAVSIDVTYQEMLGKGDTNEGAATSKETSSAAGSFQAEPMNYQQEDLPF